MGKSGTGMWQCLEEEAGIIQWLFGPKDAHDAADDDDDGRALLIVVLNSASTAPFKMK